MRLRICYANEIDCMQMHCGTTVLYDPRPYFQLHAYGTVSGHGLSDVFHATENRVHFVAGRLPTDAERQNGVYSTGIF
jgi:hypothetical protein